MKTWKLLYTTLVIGGLAFMLQGCAFLTGAAVGAAGNEAMDDEGYEFESPVQKEDDDD